MPACRLLRADTLRCLFMRSRSRHKDLDRGAILRDPNTSALDPRLNNWERHLRRSMRSVPSFLLQGSGSITNCPQLPRLTPNSEETRFLRECLTHVHRL